MRDGSHPFRAIPVDLNHITQSVIAMLVPAIPNIMAQRKNNRGDRDKPGHDRRRNGSI
jgi:hypothetical protein